MRSLGCVQLPRRRVSHGPPLRRGGQSPGCRDLRSPRGSRVDRFRCRRWQRGRDNHLDWECRVDDVHRRHRDELPRRVIVWFVQRELFGFVQRWLVEFDR